MCVGSGKDLIPEKEEGVCKELLSCKKRKFNPFAYFFKVWLTGRILLIIVLIYRAGENLEEK